MLSVLAVLVIVVASFVYDRRKKNTDDLDRSPK